MSILITSPKTMKGTSGIVALIVLAGCHPKKAEAPVSLPDVIERKDFGTGPPLLLLSQGYRGELRTVLRTGLARELKSTVTGEYSPPPVETIEYTHVGEFGPLSAMIKERALCLFVGARDKRDPASNRYSFPTLYISNLPTLEYLKGLNSVEEYEAVFGRLTDGHEWTAGRMAFSLNADGSVRVVDITLLLRFPQTTIQGTILREGIFKPTGKPPQLE